MYRRIDKEEARAQIRKRLAAVDAESLMAADKKIIATLLEQTEFCHAATILSYASFGREISTKALNIEILTQGKRLCLPRIIGKGLMEVRLVSSFADLEPAAFGILTPKADCPLMSRDDIDLVLLPGLAFDEDLRRLGRGGGYYDRYMQGFSGKSVGLVREMQLLHQLPYQDWDIKADMLITEARILLPPNNYS